ncbi:hypothetical protein [Rothia nasimurium]|uniref:hypothetical protein n=1 Tax=Rothia nasimurium TaxID=85336 RepID=UPI00117AB14B|nr:hypothetical protein [Rothia nasimurium]
MAEEDRAYQEAQKTLYADMAEEYNEEEHALRTVRRKHPSPFLFGSVDTPSQCPACSQHRLSMIQSKKRGAKYEIDNPSVAHRQLSRDPDFVKVAGKGSS